MPVPAWMNGHLPPTGDSGTSTRPRRAQTPLKQRIVQAVILTIGGILAVFIGVDLAKRNVPGALISTVVLSFAASTLHLANLIGRGPSYTFICRKPGCRVRITTANTSPAELDRIQALATEHNLVLHGRCPMKAVAFTPQGKNATTGESIWATADFESYEHLLETTGAWIPTPVDRPIVFGRHSQHVANLDTPIVVTDIGTPADLARRTGAAAADSPEVHLLFAGTLGRGKASSAALDAAASRIHGNLQPEGASR